MASVNKVIIVGHLGRDPETRYLPSGEAVTNISVATTESWKDKASGERKERTEWHRVSVQNDNLVSIIEKYVRKGSKVYIEGQLQTRKWTDKDGADKYSTEVVLKSFGGVLQLLDSKGGGSNEENSRDVNDDKPTNNDDQEIPF